MDEVKEEPKEEVKFKRKKMDPPEPEDSGTQKFRDPKTGELITHHEDKE